MSLSISAPYPLLPLPTSSSQSRRPFHQPGAISLPKLPGLATSLATELAPCNSESGLRTPPTEDMSTAYQPPLAALESHALPKYPSSLGHMGRANMAVGEPGNLPLYRLPAQPYEQQYSYPQKQLQQSVAPAPTTYPTVAGNDTTRVVAESVVPSQQPARAATPTSEGTAKVPSDGPSPKKNSDTLVYHSLTIPRCISPNGGNLAELAAQMTCLFWFESADQLKQAERFRSRQPTDHVSRLPTLARPDAQFRKWVLSVLSTTQVTQNVILLALLFIYRLKMSTPQIKGREGSEYRLLIVALMLGNKFLDDNTYTNKTWAEVSCFQVKEIHVMEVEFLSNMRYNLLASKQEWEEWLEKLACFHEYYEQAQRLPISPVLAISPTYTSPLASPTTTIPPIIPEMLPVTPTKMTNLPSSRKRSLEDGIPDHPAKRLVPSGRYPPSATPQSANPLGSNRLPVPLSITTNLPHNLPPPHPASQISTPYHLPTNYATPAISVSNQVSLPPLQPGVRAMSTIYQQPAPATVPTQQTIPTTMPPTLPTASFPAPTLPSQTPAPYPTAGRRHSPGSLTPYGSSPLPEQFGPGSVIHTPIANSPSVYLQHRNSPYRPIRHVNTLLYPPPSASLDQYHMGVPLQPTQMHYQPLGRRHDVRTGVVPEFVVYNRGQHQPLPPQMTPQAHYPG